VSDLVTVTQAPHHHNNQHKTHLKHDNNLLLFCLCVHVSAVCCVFELLRQLHILFIFIMLAVSRCNG